MKEWKKFFKSISTLFAVLAVGTLVACSSDDNTPPTDKPDPSEPSITDPEVYYDGNVAHSKGILFSEGTQLGNGDQNFVFTGKETLKKGTYLMKGWIYVADGADLTIEPGTIIKGDKQTKAALIVERGGKIHAQGTENAPIVFTSEHAVGQRKPGDWGGVILCGKAPNNQGSSMQIEGGPRSLHGGNEAADSSGELSYVRIEFAGYPFEKDKEINGLTLGSVGNGTKLDHIQVSYSNDDSFEWFGGSVNSKYLVAYKGWDDDFDTDNGFSGHIQFGLVVRDPRIADVSQSNAFESDNAADGAEISPFTQAVFSNITVIGPGTDQNTNAGFENTPNYINGGSLNPNNGAGLGKFQAALHVRRNSRLACHNSVFVGFPIGLILDGQKGNTVHQAQAGNLHLENLYFAGMDVIGTDSNKEYRDILGVYENGEITYDETKPSFSSTYFKSIASNQIKEEKQLDLVDGKHKVGQNYLPGAGSVLLNGANFSTITSSFITPVNYIGAFSGPSDTWMDGWTNFDPQNTTY